MGTIVPKYDRTWGHAMAKKRKTPPKTQARRRKKTPKLEPHRRQGPGLLDREADDSEDVVQPDYANNPEIQGGMLVREMEDQRKVGEYEERRPAVMKTRRVSEGPTGRTEKQEEETMKPKVKKAILKVTIDAEIIRRARMSAGDQDRSVGDVVAELLDRGLPDWKQK